MKICTCPDHINSGKLFPLSDFGRRSDRIGKYLSRRHKCLYRIQVERGYKKAPRKKVNPNEKTRVKFKCHWPDCGKIHYKTLLWQGPTENLDGTALRGYCIEHKLAAGRMVAFHTGDEMIYG